MAQARPHKMGEDGAIKREKKNKLFMEAPTAGHDWQLLIRARAGTLSMGTAAA